MNDTDYITAADLVTASRESASTINYWTTAGILKVARKKSGKRLFLKQESLARCKKARELQDKGYSLKLIQAELDGQRT